MTTAHPQAGTTDLDPLGRAIMFTVRFRDAGPGPRAWDALPDTYPTLAEATQAARDYVRGVVCPDAALVTTEPPGGATAGVAACTLDGRTLYFRIEQAFAALAPAEG